MARSDDREVGPGRAVPLTAQRPRELFVFFTVFTFLPLQTVAKVLYGWSVANSENRKRKPKRADAQAAAAAGWPALTEGEQQQWLVGGLLGQFVRGGGVGGARLACWYANLSFAACRPETAALCQSCCAPLQAKAGAKLAEKAVQQVLNHNDTTQLREEMEASGELVKGTMKQVRWHGVLGVVSRAQTPTGLISMLAGAGAARDGRARTEAPPTLALSVCAFLPSAASLQACDKVAEKMQKMSVGERESLHQRNEARCVLLGLVAWRWGLSTALGALVSVRGRCSGSAACTSYRPVSPPQTAQAYKAAKLLGLAGPRPAEESSPRGASPAQPLRLPPPPLPPQERPQQNPRPPPRVGRMTRAAAAAAARLAPW